MSASTWLTKYMPTTTRTTWLAQSSQQHKHSQQAAAYLLSLPGELRNEIFTLTLCQPGVVMFDPELRNDSSIDNVTALERVCKQIRDECKDLFFELSEVRMELRCEDQTYSDILDAFIKLLKNWSRAQLIQKVHLSYGDVNEDGDGFGRRGFSLFISIVTSRVNKRCQEGLRIRVSFNLILRFDHIVLEIPYSFLITNQKETAAAVDQCFDTAAADWIGVDAQDIMEAGVTCMKLRDSLITELFEG